MAPDSETDAGRDVATDERTRTRRPQGLASTVVRYDGRPDRVTFHPDDPSPEERLTAWVSVDRDAVCDLAAMR
ncbi:DUF7511 domain-containing protein [Halospeciosus flavus]|uniref:DUF7511 domain-containing protein n=1 Tax=Halospeciosus flavus TaxID=3032283 RepID=A0ABD5Z1P6_9EURY|nr:hypothetical protein [Halospeciosus flavus]